MPWTKRQLAPTDIAVGSWAWDANLLLDPQSYPTIAAHPSLLVIHHDVTDADLLRIGEQLQTMPAHAVMLSVREPEFTRRLPGLIEQKMKSLGRSVIDVLSLWVSDEPSSLKSGSSLQIVFDFRSRGLVRWLGLGHDDVRAVEWFAKHTPARVLQIPHHMDDLSAHYRAIAAAEEFGMACVAQPCSHTDQAWRLALGHNNKVLPICSDIGLFERNPDGVGMNDDELAAAWSAYQATHTEPEPLPRGKPPME